MINSAAKKATNLCRLILFFRSFWLLRADVFVLAIASASGATQGATCKPTTFDSHQYTVCDVNLATEELEVFRVDDSGVALGSLQRLEEWLNAKNRRLLFAMNAGMFNSPTIPTGLLVLRGAAVSEISLLGWPGFRAPTKKESGNFYVIPNAVFWIKDQKALVQDSLSYHQDKHRPTVDMAIQSGPMLVKGGDIPKDLILYGSPHYKRNGVCAISPSQLKFVISNVEVSIHEFARFMRNHIKCTDALYLDGCRSALFSANLKRSDESCKNKGVPTPLGAIVAVVENRPTGSTR